MEWTTPPEPREPSGPGDPGPPDDAAAHADASASNGVPTMLAAKPERISGLKALGILVASFVAALAAMWLAASLTFVLLGGSNGKRSVGVDITSTTAGASRMIDAVTHARAGVVGMAVLAAVAAALIIAKWCNQPSRRHIRVPLNVGFGLAAGLVAVGALLYGLCLSLTSMY